MRRLRIDRRFFLLGILLVWLYPVEGASQSTILLSFKSQASVQKEMVYLGDIATIKGSPRSVVEKMGRLKIQASPQPGEVSILSRPSLASRIEGSGFSHLIANLQIPEGIEVTRQGRVLEREDAARILEDHLQKILGDERKSVRVKEIQGTERFVVPPGPISWEVKSPERFYQGGNMPFSLILLADGEKVQEARLNARLEIYADVVVAKNYLPRHQIVEDKDVQVINKNITMQPPDVVTDLKDILGKRTTLSINNQETLRKSMVEVPPLVKKGDRVILLVERDHFRITAQGEVKEDGREGDRIRVVNTFSKREVYGRVLDAQTVQVDF
jgi:flagella basal body P-ring formation protein FlgA